MTTPSLTFCITSKENAYEIELNRDKPSGQVTGRYRHIERGDPVSDDAEHLDLYASIRFFSLPHELRFIRIDTCEVDLVCTEPEQRRLNRAACKRFDKAAQAGTCRATLNTASRTLNIYTQPPLLSLQTKT